jgi:hypothetical protein
MLGWPGQDCPRLLFDGDGLFPGQPVFYVYFQEGSIYIMGTSEQDKEKVFNLSKEMIENNQHIDNQREKMKGIKGAIKAFQERNEAIVNEIEVRTGDQELFDLEEDD